MIPDKLEMVDFLSHQNSTIEFDKFDIALVVGEIEGNEGDSNGCGKCLDGESLISMSNGGFKKLKDCIVGDQILCLNKTGKLVTTKIVKCFKRVDQRVLVEFASGSKIVCTKDHPLLTSRINTNPFLALEEIKDEHIGIARAMPFGESEIEAEEINVLAYLLAEGNIGKTNRSFTNCDVNIIRLMKESLKNFGLTIQNYAKDGKNWQITELRKGRSEYLRNFAKDYEFYEKISLAKFLSSKIFQFNKKSSEIFLARFFECDGSISWCKAGKYKKRQLCKWNLSISSSSWDLILGLKLFLLRFGVIGRIVTKASQYTAGKKRIKLGHSSYELTIDGTNQQRRVASILLKYVIHSEKKSKLNLLLNDQRIENTNVDIIPRCFNKYLEEVWKDNCAVLRQNGLTQYYRNNYSRSKFQIAAKCTNSEILTNIANSDIFWDKIKSKKEVGLGEVYDIEVDSENHNFIANGVVVHNSSIIDAITFVLFEKTRASNDECLTEDIIRDGAEKAIVRYWFWIKNIKYKVVREKSKTEHKLYLYLYNGNSEVAISGESIALTEAKICNILSLDYNTFKSSGLFEQGNIKFFTDKRPEKRKEVIRKILNLEKYDKCAERSKKYRDKYDKLYSAIDTELKRNQDIDQLLINSNKELQRFKTDIDNTKVILQSLTKDREELIQKKNKIEESNKQQEVNSVKRDNLIKQLKEVEKNIEDLKRDGSAELTVLKNSFSKLDELEDKLKKSKEELIELFKVEQETNTIQSQVTQVEEKIKDLDVKLKERNFIISEKNKKLKNIEDVGADCDKCFQKVDIKHKTEHTQSLTEAIRQLNTEQQECLSSFNELIKQNTETKAILMAKLQKVKKIPDCRLTIQHLEVEIEKAKKSKEEFNKIKVKLQNRAQELTNIKTELSNQINEISKNFRTDLLDELKQVSIQIDDINKKIDQTQSKLSELNKSLGINEERLNSLCDKKFYQVLYTSVVDSIFNTKKLYDELVDSFGKKVQNKIIEDTVEEIGIEANKWLQIFSLGRLQLSIKLNKKNKTRDTTTDTFGIYIIKNNKEKPYSLFSGGEKLRVDFAIRIALSQLLVNRSGATLDFLILDEVESGLDEKGKKLFIDILAILTKHFKKILIITHNVKMQAAFTTTIKVIKKNDVSYICA